MPLRVRSTEGLAGTACLKDCSLTSNSVHEAERQGQAGASCGDAGRAAAEQPSNRQVPNYTL
jgi:hypothetical protein